MRHSFVRRPAAVYRLLEEQDPEARSAAIGTRALEMSGFQRNGAQWVWASPSLAFSITRSVDNTTCTVKNSAGVIAKEVGPGMAEAVLAAANTAAGVCAATDAPALEKLRKALASVGKKSASVPREL